MSDANFRPKFIDCVQNNAFENYFYVEGITSKLGGNKYSVITERGNTALLRPDKRSASFTQKALSLLKLASYFTVIIPLIMLCGKIVYRQSHKFLLSQKKIVQSQPFQNRDIQPPKPNPLTNHTITPITNPKINPTQPQVNPKVLSLAERITVGTYNILFPQKFTKTGDLPPIRTDMGYGVDKEGKYFENSAFRVGVIANNILKSNLDVITLQEVTPDVKEDLQKRLGKDYDIYYAQHKKAAHGVAVAFKKHKFTKLSIQTKTATFPTNFNNKPGEQTRSHIMIDIQDIATNKVFRVVSAHATDPRDLKATEKGLHVNKILHDVEAFKPQGYTVDRTILAGDWNQDQWGNRGEVRPATPGAHQASAFQELFKKNFHVDTNLNSTEFGVDKISDLENLQGGALKDVLKSRERRIDWLFVQNVQPEYLELPDQDLRGSDHKLTAVTVK